MNTEKITQAQKTKDNSGQNATPSIASLRRALSAKYGKRNYKIKSSGEVVAFGERPSARRDGWHHIGYVSDTLLYLNLDMLSID